VDTQRERGLLTHSADVLMGIAVGLYLLATVLLQIYGLNAYVMIFLFLRFRKRRQEEERAVLAHFGSVSDADLPVVTTQLPIYNERNVVERLLRAVCAFDYPREKHEIQVLDDSTDETVQISSRLIARLREQGHEILHVRRADRKGYKAGALAEGLRRARGEFITIFDADFVPPSDFLRRTVPFLLEDERCGFVQTRWEHRNRDFSPLTTIQSIGIDGHFVVEQSARSWSGLFFNFNGTAGLWRKRAIEDAGGWKADTLTEDLDLSYRTLLNGWRARFLLDVGTPAEIPTNIQALKSQQHRWAKGSIQAARKLLPIVWRARGIPLFKRIEATLHLTHYLIHPLILLLTILILPLALFGQGWFVNLYLAPLIVLMFAGLIGPSSMYMFAQIAAGRGWGRALRYLPALTAVGIGLAVNNTRAVLGGLLSRGGEFVRTPKLGALAERGERAASGGSVAYRIRPNRLCWLEILMGLWSLAAFAGCFHRSGAMAGPFLLIQAGGFTYVGVLSLLHQRERTVAPPPSSPAPPCRSTAPRWPTTR
jgi:cellulose synthase/poly-beta-1,6-N-acetylglucosamine synthase-like glycosyltransferase